MEIDLETKGLDRGNLALSLSTAVHLVIPVCFLASSHLSMLVAVILALGISQIQSRCVRKPSSHGLWQCQLVWCACVSSVCAGLVSSLCALDVLHVCSGLGGQDTAVPVLAGVTCLVVTELCALGLERSGILRFLLTISIVAASLLTVANSDLTSIFNENEENNTTEPEISTSMVSHATVLMLGGFLPSPSTPGEPFLLTVQKSFISNILAAVIYSIITFSFHLLYVKGQHPTAVSPGSLLLGILASDWRRLLAAILQTLCLGLSLPELVLSSCACALRLCGRVIPRWLARETLYTGTHVTAFLFSGLISTTLATLFSVAHLVELFCAAHISSDALDAVLTLYTRHQPSYYHKERGKGGQTARYEMLATSEGGALMREEKEAGAESDDSGHSSDTDIDAAVAEFRVRAKVVGDLSKPVTLEPTPESGRKSLICLSVAVSLFLLSGILLRHSLVVPSLVPIIVGIGVLLAQSMLPAVSDVSGESGSWLVSLCLLIDCLLISQVSVKIIAICVVWHLIGQLLSFKYGSRRLHQMTQRLRSMTLSRARPAANRSDSLHVLQ